MRWRRAGCSSGRLSLTDALPESTCSSRRASHRDYQEKARREIRAAAGKGDIGHSWQRGCPAPPPTHLGRGGGWELCPRCPHTPGVCREGPICLPFSSQVTFPSIFLEALEVSGHHCPSLPSALSPGSSCRSCGVWRVPACGSREDGEARESWASHFPLQRG